MKKSLFITVSICFALILGTASQIDAQSTYPIGGTAGFETGLHQLVGNLQLDHVAHLGDANPLGAVIHWGDNTLTEPGLLVCHGIGLNTDPCDIYGTHLYTSAGPYTITIEYDDLPTIPGVGNGPRQSLTVQAKGLINRVTGKVDFRPVGHDIREIKSLRWQIPSKLALFAARPLAFARNSY